MKYPSTCMAALLAIALPLCAINGGGDGDAGPAASKRKPLRLPSDLVLELLSTSAMTGPMQRQDFAWIGPQLEARFDPELDYGVHSDLFGQFELDKHMSAKSLLETMSTIAGANQDPEGSRFDAIGNQLLLVHEQAVVDKMKLAWQQVLHNTAPGLRVEYLFFDVGPEEHGPTPGILDAGKALDLLEKANAGEVGRVLFHGSASVRSGESLSLGRQRHQKIVGDINVEIAQESSAGDPITIDLDLGLGLSLRPILAPDGERFALFGLFSSRELDGGVQTESLVTKALKRIDQVRIDYRQNAFSLMLGDGQALLLAPGGAEQPGLRVLIQLRRGDQRLQDPAGVALIPTGLISTGALQPKKPRVGVPDWFPARGISVGFIEDSVSNLLVETDDMSIVQSHPEFLLVKSKAADQGRKVLDRLSADLTRSFVIEVRQEVQPLEDLRAPWSPHGQAVRILTMGNRLGFAMNGYEQTFTGDYEVEVAQKANIGDPKQRACFVGFRGWAAAVPAGDSVLVHLDLRDSSLQEWRRISTPTEATGDMTLPAIEEVHIQQQLSMTKGETRSLGEGARCEIHGVPHRTRLTVQLIER